MLATAQDEASSSSVVANLLDANCAGFGKIEAKREMIDLRMSSAPRCTRRKIL
jgi:hypothetical protein